MDPVSRRYVWKHISAIKNDRVILLTTHAMEEADLLADNVAIMCNGELQAFGTPLELKSKYGSALQMSIISEKDDTGIVEEHVMSAFSESLPYIQFESGTSGYSTLTIKKVSKEIEVKEEGVSVSVLSSFIGWCEDDSSPVKEFGVSNSSLEEVFLTVTRDAPQISPREHEHHGCCSCCCCCKRSSPRTSSEAEVATAVAIPPSQNVVYQAPKVNISNYSRKLSVPIQVKAILRFLFARSWTGRPSIVNWVFFSIFCVASMITGEYGRSLRCIL